eukprot:TRINITY_DN8183_c0_g1_i1.p1 TRINITY_DN8183_c0_g1~~TRINITY_DN8183_c0_g1_i1.p1  ORF type:complete len:544 (+),score=141.28 TRINITY_DN8183_c0_g1_i1:43-1632(+)
MDDNEIQDLKYQLENEKIKTNFLKRSLSMRVGSLDTGSDFFDGFDSMEEGCSLSIIVLGGSGDLAKKKTFPALFSLFREELLDSNVIIYGYARSEIDLDAFREQIVSYIDAEGNEDILEEFQKRVFYHRGQYDSSEDFSKLNDKLEKKEASDFDNATVNNRLYYLALPSTVFISVATAIRSSAISPTGWNRLIVEKPFGRDLESSRELSQGLAEVWPEPDTFRIDHYLGKEMVQNLMILRFANSVWEPLWNRQYIKSVKITFKENFGTGGRGHYFDKFGIIRDVMQNHLMQVLSLIAMEPPISLGAEDIRDEKVKVVRSILPLSVEDVVVGQYVADDKGNEGYLDDETVPEGSKCPTFAQAIIRINNSRWKGVPFIMKSAKAVEERKAEVRIQFHNHPSGLFESSANELVIRIQPNNAIYLVQTSKIPGLSNELTKTSLDLSYNESFAGAYNPEAYERLILEAINGSSNLFVRVDELDAAWKIFSPLLHELEEKGITPLPYVFGSRGPKEADIQGVNVGYRLPPHLMPQ